MENKNIDRNKLQEIAVKAMTSHGFEPDFPQEALKQLDQIQNAPLDGDSGVRDLTSLLWCSIDNDDSKDLDQISVSEKLPDGKVKILIGVADVEATVKLQSPLDRHAQKNTTSIYTGVRIFPMLPEKLSTNLTSLSANEVRLAFVVEMIVDDQGAVVASDIYRAKVKNKSKLAYNSVAAWLDGKAPIPPAAGVVPGMDEQLRVQDQVAQKMKKIRYAHGALTLESIEPSLVVKDDVITDLVRDKKNRAQDLIEDFMIAANGVVATYLNKNGYGALRRVVRTPKRWDKIVQVAHDKSEKLPDEPDSKALSDFLTRQKEKDPVHFPDLSLTIVKLIGRGEYVLEVPGQKPPGHFGLAVQDYTHSTAPNRRYPDLITQRLLKAALVKNKSPYTKDELSALAAHCTERESEADKVERQVRKSASASFLSNRIGEYFEAIVTGASEKGTWVRVMSPPVEGKVTHNAHGLDTGDRVRVKLVGVNIDQGWIDFVKTP